MRRVWVAILTVWALIALVAVLAWAHRPGATPVASGQALIVKGAGGKAHVVLVQPGGVHGTTATSAPVVR
jgi:hypothetical protein